MKPLELSSGITGFFNEFNEWQCTGTQMGRRNIILESDESKLYLRKLKLVNGCYDKWGAYWGGPDNLYIAFTHETQIFVRADSRHEAKSEVRKIIPLVKFHR